MNKRKLFLLLLLLSLIVYGFSYLSVSKNTIITNDQLVSLEIQSIDKMVVSLPHDLPSIQIVKDDGNWLATQSNVTSLLEKTRINLLLNKLTDISSSKIVGSTEKDQKTFGVNAKGGIRIELFQNNKLLDDLDFSLYCNRDSSFLKMHDGQEIYLIDFCISNFISNNFNYLRNQELTSFSPDKVTSFGWINARDESLNYFIQKGKWISKGEFIQDNKVMKFLKQLSNLNSNQFVDDIDEASLDELFLGKLTIAGVELDKVIEISCFFDKDRKKPYLMHSNLNPHTFFESDSLGIFQKCFEFVDSSFFK